MRFLAKPFFMFLKKENGPSAVEYAVMLALIVVVSLAAIMTTDSTNQAFGYIGSEPDSGS